MRWRRRLALPPEVVQAWRSFADVGVVVQRARDHLMLGVPMQRRARLPMAEALAGFEQGLADVGRAMAGWRIAAVEDHWTACARGLEEATERAERLRLGEDAGAYEDLVPVMEELLEPLQAFDRAAARFEELAGRGSG